MSWTSPWQRRGKALILCAAAMLAASCETTKGKGADEPDKLKPPTITRDMPLEQALEAGVRYGGVTITDVKRLVKHRNEGAAAGKLLEDSLHRGMDTYENAQLLNAGHLYGSMPVPVSVKLFSELTTSPKLLVRQLGWQLAAMKPSPKLARAVDAELSRALAEDEEDQVMMPQMANAVRSNHMAGAYTLMREGLMQKGDEEYATAMMSLDSQRASDDFLGYLALANAEELRQLTMSSINLYTAVTILKHMQQVPPSAGAPNFEHLFDYAVSRNTGLADLAEGVIETFIPARTEMMAAILAHHPAWEQMAFCESARRRLGPKIGLLLSELKRTSAESDVIEEIGEIKL